MYPENNFNANKEQQPVTIPSSTHSKLYILADMNNYMNSWNNEVEGNQLLGVGSGLDFFDMSSDSHVLHIWLKHKIVVLTR